MEKILNKDYRNELFKCLEEAGIESKVAKDVINKRYKEALKKAVIDRLSNIIEAIKKDDYSYINQYIASSPAGGGCDNHYIIFDDISDCEDIGDVIYALSNNE